MTLTSIWLPCGSWSTRGDGFNLKSTQIYHHQAWHWVGLGLGQYSRQKEQHLTGRAPLCCCSVAKSCPTLCNLMDCSTPGLPVFHHLLEFAQVHVHWIGDAIQPSHPLSSPSPPAFHLSQHQGLFQWVCCSYQVAEVLGALASVTVTSKVMNSAHSAEWPGAVTYPLWTSPFHLQSRNNNHSFTVLNGPHIIYHLLDAFENNKRTLLTVMLGIGMGNTCKSMADSCQCMTKTTTIL